MASEFPMVLASISPSIVASKVTKVVVWEGLLETLILVTKLHHLKIFDLTKYHDNIQTQIYKLIEQDQAQSKTKLLYQN